MRRGRPPTADVLTPREWEVLVLLREGLTNAELAERLGISANTAKYHVAEILGKLGVGTREEAARWSPKTRAPGFGWLVRWWPAGAVGKVVAGLAAAAVVAGFVVALAVLARQDEAGLGRLVWVQDGDLWVRTLPDGPPRRLTTDGGNTLPRWSPSGEWLLYFHGDQPATFEVRVVGADGTRSRTLEARPFLAQWSLAGDELVAGRPDGSIAIENASGESRRAVLTPAVGEGEASMTMAMWTPDGKRLVFAEERWLKRASTVSPGVPPDAERTYVGLSVIDADGSNRRELLNLGSHPTSRIAPLGWTAGGTALLFVTVPAAGGDAILDGSLLRAVDLDSGDVLDLDVRVTLNQRGEDGAGPTIVVAGEGRETWTNKYLARVDVDAGQIGRLTAPGAATVAPAASADGERIAYVSAPNLGGARDRALASRRIWVMDADGANARQVSRDEEYRHEAPRWSNDGEHILFARLTTERCSPSWTLQLLNLRGGSTREVANGLPDIATYNERPVVGQVPECAFEMGTGSILDSYGNVNVGQAYEWWQPR